MYKTVIVNLNLKFELFLILDENDFMLGIYAI